MTTEFEQLRDMTTCPVGVVGNDMGSKQQRSKCPMQCCFGCMGDRVNDKRASAGFVIRVKAFLQAYDLFQESKFFQNPTKASRLFEEMQRRRDEVDGTRNKLEQSSLFGGYTDEVSRQLWLGNRGSIMTEEYRRLLNLANRHLWAVPAEDDTFGEEPWIRYWQAMQEREQDPSITGRPIPPHRTGRF